MSYTDGHIEAELGARTQGSQRDAVCGSRAAVPFALIAITVRFRAAASNRERSCSSRKAEERQRRNTNRRPAAVLRPPRSPAPPAPSTPSAHGGAVRRARAGALRSVPAPRRGRARRRRRRRRLRDEAQVHNEPRRAGGRGGGGREAAGGAALRRLRAPAGTRGFAASPGGQAEREPPQRPQMKCENCTKKECSKKQKNDDAQSTSVDVLSPNDDFEEKNEFFTLANAKILLSDCLACDNCMTSEEGARVFQQNQKEFFRILNLNKKCDTSKHKVLAVSICPQSLPYFAAKFSLSVNDAAKRLCGFLKSLGVHYVFDTTIAADFSILESQREFVQRYQRRNQEEHALPMFASACPGWIRYAERVLTNLVTPHICTAKSPQQIMGSLVKGYFARQQNLSPEKIFHVVVAPCYDKKLEALREDFYTALYNSQEVDCVLTSGEIVQIMEQKNVSMKDVTEVAVDSLFGEIKEGDVVRHDGKRSDGYLEHIFKHAAKELFGMDVKEITYKALKNKDFQEVTLEKDGETVLRFAAAYGFRNIQNMVLKLKKGKFLYHFVEVLACPGGCLNGKGQTQTEDGKPDKALLSQMEDVYAAIPVRLPEANVYVQKMYQDWLEGMDSRKVQETLHTKYSAVNQTASNLDIKW